MVRCPRRTSGSRPLVRPRSSAMPHRSEQLYVGDQSITEFGDPGLAIHLSNLGDLQGLSVGRCAMHQHVRGRSRFCKDAARKVAFRASTDSAPARHLPPLDESRIAACIRPLRHPDARAQQAHRPGMVSARGKPTLSNRNFCFGPNCEAPPRLALTCAPCSTGARFKSYAPLSGPHFPCFAQPAGLAAACAAAPLGAHPIALPVGAYKTGKIPPSP